MNKGASKTLKTNPSKINNVNTKFITIFGFDGCGYYNAALDKLDAYVRKYNASTKFKSYKLKLVKHCVNRTMWPSIIRTYATNVGLSHTTSPLIFFESTYIGGHDALVVELDKIKPFGI